MAFDWLSSADLHLFNYINHYAGQNYYIDKTAVFFAEYLIFAFIIFLLIEIKNKKLLLNTILSVCFSLLFNYAFSFFYARPRPFAAYDVNLLVQHVNDASFPSTHAAISFAIAASIFLYNRRYGIASFIIAFLISFARVFVGAHYISDVVAGAFLGAIFAYLSSLLLLSLSKNKTARKWLQ